MGGPSRRRVPHLRFACEEWSTRRRWIHKTKKDLGPSEGSHCAGFVVLDVENRVQLGDLQQVVDLLGEIEELKIPALVADGGKCADQFADS
jgi:hypothetical protein